MEVVFTITVALVGFALGYATRAQIATADLREAAQAHDRTRLRLIEVRNEAENYRAIAGIYKGERR
jgi:hypothetical protein